MAKDFSNPKKLGFMRVLQFFFAFNVIVTISLLAFLIKGSYELEFSNILDFVNLIFDSISFWLIWQRKRLARHFIIGFSPVSYTHLERRRCDAQAGRIGYGQQGP